MDWLKVSLVPEGRVMNVLKELKTGEKSSMAVRNVCYTLSGGAGFCLLSILQCWDDEMVETV